MTSESGLLISTHTGNATGQPGRHLSSIGWAG